MDGYLPQDSSLRGQAAIANARLAYQAFEKTFVSQIVLDITNDRAPLEGIGQAPQDYWDAFKNKAEQLEDRRLPFYLPESIPPAYFIQAVANEMRVM